MDGGSEPLSRDCQERHNLIGKMASGFFLLTQSRRQFEIIREKGHKAAPADKKGKDAF